MVLSMLTLQIVEMLAQVENMLFARDDKMQVVLLPLAHRVSAAETGLGGLRAQVLSSEGFSVPQCPSISMKVLVHGLKVDELHGKIRKILSFEGKQAGVALEGSNKKVAVPADDL
jgi:hypothetical protein